MPNKLCNKNDNGQQNLFLIYVIINIFKFKGGVYWISFIISSRAELFTSSLAFPN